MLPKYELTSESQIVEGVPVYRIRAMRDFGTVKTGERGGWIAVEHNLSHDGYCWVGGNAVVCGKSRVIDTAQVSGDARVYGDAKVYGDAHVVGNAQVTGNAWVGSNAQVSGDARVSGHAWVSGNARVSGSARVSEYGRVSGKAQISGNAHVYGEALVLGGTWTTSPAQIQGSRDFITHSSPGHITIGCQTHPIAHWLSEARNIGKENGYTDAEIEEYLRYIRRIADIEEKANASKV